MTERILLEVFEEVQSATELYPPMHTAHEGWALLLEEVDELWDYVKAKPKYRDVTAMRKEAVQVTAMAIRFIHDICDGGRGNK